MSMNSERPDNYPMRIDQDAALERVPETTGSMSTELYGGIATLSLTKEQVEIILSPVSPQEIEFRWGDNKQTFALAYPPQVATRRRLNEAFGPGSWGLRVVRTYIEPIIDEDTGQVVEEKFHMHGALYVNGSFVAEGMGEATFRAKNRSMSRSTAWESAKSDCIGRCAKDLGCFSELWDKKFLDSPEVKTLREEWIAKNTKERRACPKCHNAKFFLQDKDDKTRWFCWKKPDKDKFGCGWSGNPDAETREVAQPQPTAFDRPEADTPTPAPTPPARPRAKPKATASNKDEPSAGSQKDLALVLSTLSRFVAKRTVVRKGKNVEMTGPEMAMELVEKLEGPNRTEANYVVAIAHAKAQIAARKDSGELEQDDLPF